MTEDRTERRVETMQKALVAKMKGLPFVQKAEVLMDLGDERLRAYAQDKDPRDKKLAANCYIAARRIANYWTGLM